MAGSAALLYFHQGHPWWLFLALVLAPDVAFVGFVAGTRVGAVAYNATHTYLVPVALAAAGVFLDGGTAVAVGLVWLTHIGVDRTIGYGLKYPSAFRDTHLQRV